MRFRVAQLQEEYAVVRGFFSDLWEWLKEILQGVLVLGKIFSRTHGGTDMPDFREAPAAPDNPRSAYERDKNYVADDEYARWLREHRQPGGDK